MEVEWKSSESPPRAALFDLDGVLVDSSAFHLEAWQAWAREAGLADRVTESWFEATFGRRNADVFATLFDRELSADELTRHSERKEALFRERARGRLEPLSGAPELVRALQDAGFRLALGTSAPRENADMMLAELGLTRFFATRITGEDVRAGKPHPDVFEQGAAALRVPPDRCVVLEDAEAGVEAARRAGMAVVAVTDDPQPGHRQADRVVGSLAELDVAALEALIASAKEAP